LEPETRNQELETIMAIVLKSKSQIEKLRAAGRLVAETYEVLREQIVPGVSTADLDRIAEEYLRKHGGVPAYKGYGEMRGRGGKLLRPAFPATICAAVNDVICHGVPSKKEVLREGDIIGIDIGVLLDGWIGDSCVTFAVGAIDAESQRLMDVAKRAMELGIEQALPTRRLGDIGAAIQQYAEGHGFSVVREWTGHGVGRTLHESDLTVFHYGTPNTGLKMRPGMVFTIEPMINAGAFETRVMKDGWTVRTIDGKRSAQFEHTIAITDGAPEILTKL
jgi:methionyl aminopeptidase